MKLWVASPVWLLLHKLTRQVLHRCVVKELTPYIESVISPIIFCKLCLWPKNCPIFGLDLGKISICGDIPETRCRSKIAVFFIPLKRRLFEEF